MLGVCFKVLGVSCKVLAGFSERCKVTYPFVGHAVAERDIGTTVELF